jgi:hypothetical protein
MDRNRYATRLWEISFIYLLDFVCEELVNLEPLTGSPLPLEDLHQLAVIRSIEGSQKRQQASLSHS